MSEEWITIKSFKNVDVFTVKPNEEFDLNEKSSLSFKNPIFLYTYLRCVAKSEGWSGKLIMIENNSKYTIIPDDNINEDLSIIQVLVMESDDY